jgi:5-methylcytosine-specific restriction protein A
MKVRNKKFRFCGKGPNGLNMCFYGCGKEVVRPRRNWCSDECVHEGKIRSDPGYARDQVFKRDHGVCCRCSIDTVQMRLQILRDTNSTSHLEPLDPNHINTYQENCDRRDRAKVRADLKLAEYVVAGWPADMSRSFWEAHHKQAVVEGGGCCGLDNLETLCCVCHKKETKALRARLTKTKLTVG